MKKIKIGGMHLVGLWEEHKGLIALLCVGGMILVLAAMAPGAWATPNQSPLRKTVPQGDVLATDVNGVEKNLFNAGEAVYVRAKNGAFAASNPVDIYVVPDAAWAVNDAIPADVSGGKETITTNANGAFDGPPYPMVWASAVAGRYDAVFDENQNGIFDGGDGVDDAVLGTGFVVVPSPTPGKIVGVIFLDNNGNGEYDAGDTPLGGVTVTLDPGQPGEQQTTTNPDGTYEFTVPQGTTHVVEALGSPWHVSEGKRQDFYEGMPPEPVPVGGYALLANRFELLASWIGLTALMGVGIAAVVVRWRRRE
jgi:hypothetical protein